MVHHIFSSTCLSCKSVANIDILAVYDSTFASRKGAIIVRGPLCLCWCLNTDCFLQSFWIQRVLVYVGAYVAYESGRADQNFVIRTSTNQIPSQEHISAYIYFGHQWNIDRRHRVSDCSATKLRCRTYHNQRRSQEFLKGESHHTLMTFRHPFSSQSVRLLLRPVGTVVHICFFDIYQFACFTKYKCMSQL